MTVHMTWHNNFVMRKGIFVLTEQFVTFMQPVLEYLPLLAQKKVFLYAVGILCIIGILSKWWVRLTYNGLIRKAKNMASANNRTLRQIKIKYENFRQLTGRVNNPEMMVNSFLHNHRTFGVTLNGINKITDLCALGCIIMGGASGAVAYIYGNGKTMAASYILIGCTLAFTLEIFDKWSDVNYYHMVLVNTITDFFENVVGSPMDSIVKHRGGTDGETENDLTETVGAENGGGDMKPQTEVASTQEKEMIIEEVLSEFLQ